MPAVIYIIEQLLERLRACPVGGIGEVVGLTCPASEDIYILAASTTAATNATNTASPAATTASPAILHPMPHDPLLLLPGLDVVGGFLRQEELEVANIQKMPAAVLEHDYVLMVFVSKKELKIHHGPCGGGPRRATAYTVLTQAEFEEKVVVCRTFVHFDLSSRDKTADVKRCMERLHTELTSGTACFMLADSTSSGDGLVLRGGGGVMAYGGAITSSVQTVRMIVNSKLHQRVNNRGYCTVNSVKFNLLIDRSCNSSTSAPVVKLTSEKLTVQRTQLKGECIAYVLKSMKVADVGKVLLRSVLQHLKLAEYWLVKLLTDQNMKGDLEIVNVLPYRSGHLFTVMYPNNTPESYLKDYRKNACQTFLLPACPFLKKDSCFEFTADKTSPLLYNTHVGLKPPPIKGLSSITKGVYSYHHYMQDKFNDTKWGCAYRSLQTVVSWFRHQGYTTKPVPTHRQIQEVLVSIGDKQQTFIGSKEWIGSIEVGFVLESYIGVSSKVVTVSSGEDWSEKGRELVHHFDMQGTPIMIGGGVLAHTILGVAWDPDSGDMNFLILDPHYPGAEDLNTIQKQGWCGWKGVDFWDPKSYYNLCLPQRPAVV